MSLEMWISEKGSDEKVMSLNWLRNPFGLERLAEANTGKKEGSPENEQLWYVCNTWTYEKSNEIDRELFKKVVDNYWAIIQKLKVGYFIFSLPEYRQFVEAVVEKKLTRGDYEYRENGTKIAINMELFKEQCRFVFTDLKGLEGYRGWFQQLVAFAEKLQDPNMEFHCSV